MKPIRYKAGYEYQLEEDCAHYVGIQPIAPGGNRFVGMDAQGLLTIGAGYAWDGASGPAIDTKSIMRASLVHDALYQLIRMGVVSPDDRSIADWLLYDMLLADGLMLADAKPWLLRGPARALARSRAVWVHAAVRAFGGAYMRAVKDKILTAP